MRLSLHPNMRSMVLSIEELRAQALGMRKEGLNSQQIADELSLSQDTIAWLLAEGSGADRPNDVRIGWRSIGVRPERIAAIGTIMADVADEELGVEDIDTVVGISINGIPFAHEVARHLGAEFTIFRNVEGADGQGVLSNKARNPRLNFTIAELRLDLATSPRIVGRTYMVGEECIMRQVLSATTRRTDSS